MIIEIEEDKKEQKSGSVDYSKLMTEEQIKRGDYYQEQYLLRSGEMENKDVPEWNALDRLYQCIRDLPSSADSSAPCSFVPIITPCVEGQVASMIESNIEFRHITNNPAHEVYMRQLDAASEYYRQKTGYRQHFKDFIRYYELLGNQVVKIEWDESDRKKGGHKGMPRISVPPLNTVIFDGRIKDTKDLQRSEYIIQAYKFQSVAWARKEYGDDFADALALGSIDYDGDDPDQSIDDIKTFTLLEVWTKDNEKGNLQKIEMDTNGLILRESDPNKPVYEYVDNEYPFAIARMIPRMGKFYGVGDGHILMGIQDTVNKLTDEVEIAARFSAQTRTYVDPDAQLNPDDQTSDPSEVILCKDPRGNLFTVPGSGINPVVHTMIEYLMREAQKATRFHESMSGTQMNVSATATQINTQQAQGHVGIKDKKSDISQVMAWADMYALKLCMQFWDKSFWASVAPGKSVYVDMPMLLKAPNVVPIGMDEIQRQIAENRESGNVGSEIPKYMEVKDKDGKSSMTIVDFSSKVIIGESMPKGKTDIYNILLGLAQMQVIGKDGIPKPLITANRLKELFEDVLGFKLQTDEEEDDEGTSEQMDIMGMNAINPVGQGDNVQVPTNLQQTVPQMPNSDSRKVQI